MKKYFLNKTGESSNTYSVYENPDKKLKEEIASFDIEAKSLLVGRKKNGKFWNGKRMKLNVNMVETYLILKDKKSKKH